MQVYPFGGYYLLCTVYSPRKGSAVAHAPGYFVPGFGNSSKPQAEGASAWSTSLKAILPVTQEDARWIPTAFWTTMK